MPNISPVPGRTVVARTSSFYTKYIVCTWWVNVDHFRAAVQFWGQSSQILSRLSPKRDCGSKRTKAATTCPAVLWVWITEMVIAYCCRVYAPGAFLAGAILTVLVLVLCAINIIVIIRLAIRQCAARASTLINQNTPEKRFVYNTGNLCTKSIYLLCLLPLFMCYDVGLCFTK